MTLHLYRNNGFRTSQISPDGTTLYAAGYSALPPPTGDHIAPGGDDAKQPSSGIPPQAAVVWRHEMKPSEMRAVAGLVLRMEAFQGAQVECAE